MIGPQVPAAKKQHKGKGEQYVENTEDAKKVRSYEQEHKNRETLNEHLDHKIGDASWFYRESVLKTALSS